MSRQLTSPKAIRAYLVDAMTSGEYAACRHLPPEKELSETLNISRTQLRDVLAALEREGFITRRHGVGTIINRHVLAVPYRMDIETEFLDMIRQSGFQADVLSVQVSSGRAGEKAARCLGIPAGSQVLRVSRLCSADGKPAIYCEDVIPKQLIKGSYTISDLKLPIFHFFRHFCTHSPYLDVTDLRPVTADAALAELFQLPVGAPLLNMEEVDYDQDGTPVLLSSQFFADGIFRHTVLRKRL